MNASRTNCFSIELARTRISNVLTSTQHCFKLRSAAQAEVRLTKDFGQFLMGPAVGWDSESGAYAFLRFWLPLAPGSWLDTWDWARPSSTAEVRSTYEPRRNSRTIRGLR